MSETSWAERGCLGAPNTLAGSHASAPNCLAAQRRCLVQEFIELGLVLERTMLENWNECCQIVTEHVTTWALMLAVYNGSAQHMRQL